MKVNKENSFTNLVETFIYCIWCVISLGTVYLFRIVLTQAIKKAFENNTYEKVFVVNKSEVHKK